MVIAQPLERADEDLRPRANAESKKKETKEPAKISGVSTNVDSGKRITLGPRLGNPNSPLPNEGTFVEISEILYY